MLKSFVIGSLIFLLVTLVLLCGVKLFRVQKELEQTRKDFSAKLQEADLQLGRAATVISDANKMIGELDKNIQDEIKKRNATLDMYARLVAKYQAQGSGHITTPDPGPIVVDGEALTHLPFHFEDFRLKVDGDVITRDFNYTLNQRFELKVAETKLPSGGFNNYAELYELDPDGKHIGKLELTKFEVVRTSDEPAAKLSLFNPRLDLGVATVFSNRFTFGPRAVLGVSLASYGYSKSDPTWRFARIGMDIAKDSLGLSLAPILYNIAKPLPLVNNLWIGPAAGYDLNDKYWYGLLGISAAL